MAEILESNARDPEQLERMRHLKKSGKCFFCDRNYMEVGASDSMYDTDHWYIKKNDYPYEGTVHHYLIASKSHVTNVADLSEAAWNELYRSFKWLNEFLNVPGASIFARSGDMNYTGGTLDHLHFHFIVGKSGKDVGVEPIKVKLGYK